jgi:hypothetical protein
MRVKRGVASHKKHQKIRRATKGMTKSNRSSIKRGKQAVTKSYNSLTGTAEIASARSERSGIPVLTPRPAKMAQLTAYLLMV